MGEAFGMQPAGMQSYNWVNGLRDGVILVDAHEGEVRGTSAAISFGRTGWIGGVTVAPGHRRKGIGTATTEAACAWLAERGAETMLLFATEIGRPIYERLGFEVESDFLNFRVPADHPQRDAEPLDARDYAFVRDLDRLATGEARDVVLEAGFPRGGRVGDGGMAVRVPWGQIAAVATDPGAGRSLLGLARPGERWIVPERNEAALHVLRAGGFEETLRAPRMRRGPAVEWRPELVWGAFNLFWG